MEKEENRNNEAESPEESACSAPPTLEELQKAFDVEQQKCEEYLNNWKRAQADFINYKRNTEIEKQDIRRAATGEVMLKIVPALDDLERALASIPPDIGNAGWVEGFRLIDRKLRNNLENLGLKPIKAVGEIFNPYVHEAIKRDKGPDGKIIYEVEKGYLLQDKLLRPSKVIVGDGEDNQEKED